MKQQLLTYTKAAVTLTGIWIVYVVAAFLLG